MVEHAPPPATTSSSKGRMARRRNVIALTFLGPGAYSPINLEQSDQATRRGIRTIVQYRWIQRV